MKILILLCCYFFFYSSSYSQDTLYITPSTKLAKKILKRSNVYVNFQGKTKLSKVDYKTIICPDNKDFSWHDNPPNRLVDDSLIILQFVSYRNCAEIKIPVYCLERGCKFDLDCVEYGKNWVSYNIGFGSTHLVNGFIYFKWWKLWKRNKC